MAIDVSINGSIKDEFPIMKKLKNTSSRGLVVLFNTPDSGTVIVGSCDYSVGLFRNSWTRYDNDAVWDDFNETVCLTNK